MLKGIKGKGIEIGISILIFVLAWLTSVIGDVPGNIGMLLYFVAYCFLSVSLYLEQIKKIVKLKFLDENFLMIIATLGAFFVGRYKEAYIAMLFYQIGRLIEDLSLNGTKKSIAKFIDLRPEFAYLKTEVGEEKILPEELKVGQTIVLHPGEKIPVDAVVTKGTGNVDVKVLTGESAPRIVTEGEKIYSGSVNLNSVIEAKVSKLYGDSTASRIVSLVEQANEKKSNSVHMADVFTKYYTPIVILIAVLTIVLPPLMFSVPREPWIYRGLILLVAACPCGLRVSIPLAFLGGIGAASKQGVLVKSGTTLEDLTQVDTFVFDKTGTLTEGVFYVKDIVPNDFDKEELLEIAALTECYSKHPVALSLLEAYGKTPDLSRIKEIVEEPGYGVKAIVDGRNIFAGNSRLMRREGFNCRSSKRDGTAVHVSVDGVYAGYILIADRIREGSGKLIKWMHKKNLETIMLTGDNEKVAEAVASRLKIDSVYAELLPEDKVELVEEFCGSQIENEKLAFVGDGMNDAPVLALADIGIAMGGLGADAAIEAADIILMEDEPLKIINVMRIAKGTMRSIKQNMVLSIGVKVLLVVLAIFGLISMQNAILADMLIMVLNILNSFWMIRYPE